MDTAKPPRNGGSESEPWSAAPAAVSFASAAARPSHGRCAFFLSCASIAASSGDGVAPAIVQPVVLEPGPAPQGVEGEQGPAAALAAGKTRLEERGVARTQGGEAAGGACRIEGRDGADMEHET